MTSKTCSVCNQTKEITSFSPNGKGGVKTICKECRCNKEKQKRQDNLEKFKVKDKKYHEENKEQRNKNAKEYRKTNKDKVNAHARDKYQRNKESIKQYHQERKPTRNAVKRQRLQMYPQARIKENLTTRMSNALKHKQRHRLCKLVGCTTEFLRLWLEEHFYEDINWDNYGSVWHIDHVVPVAFFNLISLDEQLTCFHWSNLRPLYVQENLEKSDKILHSDIIAQQTRMKSYCEKLERYQADYENSWWQRLELWYGKNPEDEMCFEDTLKWVIRNQTPNMDEGSTTK